jgi:hypothetical protein
MALPSPAAVHDAASLWGHWSRPPDRPAQVALLAAVVLGGAAFAPGGARWLAGVLDFSGVGDRTRTRRFLTAGGFAAAFLSLAYIAFYLRGGPRAHQAADLWIQGRALSHGLLAWTAPDPTAGSRTARLLFRAPDRVGPIGAPGFPLLLAAGFLVGAPMLAGPLVAAALVVATWFLGREIALASPRHAAVDAEWAGRLAAGLSILCAALRHQTGDALPGGLAALATAVALAAALRASRTGSVRTFLGAGAAVGVVLATLPWASIGPALACLVCASRAPTGPGTSGAKRLASVGWLGAGTLPGALLLLAANHAATGHFFCSPAARYAATVVAPAAPTARETALALVGSLRTHLADVANLEVLALLVAVPILRARSRATDLAVLVIAVELVVAVLGVGHGRGASSVVLPIEHALMAVGLLALAAQRVASAAMLLLSLSLAGFAFHTSSAHAARAARDGGRPAYEPDVVRESYVSNGLLFVDDDDAFKLASDPGVTASHGLQAVRMRSDDHDRLVYDLLGHPPSHRFTSEGEKASAYVWTPANAGSDTWRFEAESDFPPAGVVGGRVQVVGGRGLCPADARALSLVPDGGRPATMSIEVPAPRGPTPGDARTWKVVPRVFLSGGAGQATMVMALEPGGPPLAHWSWTDFANAPACVELDEAPVVLGPETRRAWLFVTATGGPVALDKTTLRGR